MQPIIQSKLPAVGTTIFTTMSALALKHNAINLGQGFPDFPMSSELQELVDQAMKDGYNQYVHMCGLPALREQLSQKVNEDYNANINPETQITITPGGTYAIYTAFTTILRPGDEVILFEPAYDSYIPNIEINGGVAVPVALEFPDYRINWQLVKEKITSKTKAIIINTPHNPTGKVLEESDIDALKALVKDTGIFIISDEVYEHMVYEPLQHHSASSYPGLAQRAFVVSSFGKSYHVTGWKVGTVAAPASMTTEFRKVHQFNVFTVNTPVQFGLARYMSDPKPYLDLPKFYQRKRDFFRQGLSATKFKLLPGEGTYFQCADISSLSVPEKDLGEAEFCKWLTREIGVAAIPMSAFYGDSFDQNVIRFCFAKKDSTLQAAIERLAKL